MRTLKSRRGTTLVDLMVTIFLLGMAGVIFAATFPMGFACSRKAQAYKTATAIAQRKIEQLRAMNYESLTQPLLQSAGTIDSEPTGSPYSFTSVDGVADQLTLGTGALEISDVTISPTGALEISDVTTSLKRVQVTVSWQDKNSTVRSVQLTTLFADKRTRRVT